jgi:phage shock protein A
LLEKVVREVEEALRSSGAQAASAAAREARTTFELDRNRYQAQLWQSRVMRAVEAGDDDLARKAMARKREHQRHVIALEEQVEAARQASSARKCQVEVLRLRLAEAKRLLASFRRG